MTYPELQRLLDALPDTDAGKWGRVMLTAAWLDRSDSSNLRERCKAAGYEWTERHMRAYHASIQWPSEILAMRVPMPSEVAS